MMSSRPYSCSTRARMRSHESRFETSADSNVQPNSAAFDLPSSAFMSTISTCRVSRAQEAAADLGAIGHEPLDDALAEACKIRSA